jgi:predicted nuclease of predicted toxin-antitoxin system
VKLKLDENIDVRLAQILRGAGHDAVTVGEQDLHGTDDINLYRLCISENLALVPLDLDSSNILRYPPHGTPGLVVLRGPDDIFLSARTLVEILIEALSKENPLNRLWIAER